jgi:hypothetical protein
VALIESEFGHFKLPEVATKDQRASELLTACRRFIRLDEDQQFAWTLWFDYFYNRVVHHSHDPDHKVPVHFAFGTPETWEAAAAKHGLVRERLIVTGMERPLNCLFHVTHILRKQGAEQ